MVSQLGVPMQMVLAHWRPTLTWTEPPNPPKNGCKNFCHLFLRFSNYISVYFSDFCQANRTKRPKKIEVMNTTIHKARLHWVEAAGGTFTGRNKLKNTMNDKGALYLHRVVGRQGKNLKLFLPVCLRICCLELI